MRRIVGIWSVGAEVALVILFFQGTVPWYASALLSAALYLLAVNSGLLRPAWSRWAMGALCGYGGIVAPAMFYAHLPAGLDLALALSFEVFLGAWIWSTVRARFVRADDAHVAIGRQGPLGLPVIIPTEDRYLHMHVVGPTGSGKTEGVIWPLIRKDLARPLGVTVIDPKGDLAVGVADAARSMGRPVTAIGPGLPFTFNPLAGKAETVAQGMVEALDHAFPDGNTFFRTLGRTLLRQSILAVKGVPGADPGLKDLRDFLADEDGRREVLLRTRDQGAREYFRKEYASWSTKAQREYTIGLRTELAALADEAEIGRIMGGREPLDMAGILARGEVLAVSLPIGVLGESGRIFGTYLLARFQAAAIGRPRGIPHFLYLDEFQEFATPDFAEFLELARQYQVGAVLAHQNLDQLDPGLRASVLANARNRILMGGLSGRDLEALKDSLGRRMGVRVTEAADGAVKSRTLVEEPRFSPHLIRHLPRGRALAQVAVRGQIMEPSLVRLPRPGA